LIGLTYLPSGVELYYKYTFGSISLHFVFCETSGHYHSLYNLLWHICTLHLWFNHKLSHFEGFIFLFKVVYVFPIFLESLINLLHFLPHPNVYLLSVQSDPTSIPSPFQLIGIILVKIVLILICYLHHLEILIVHISCTNIRNPS